MGVTNHLLTGMILQVGSRELPLEMMLETCFLMPPTHDASPRISSFRMDSPIHTGISWIGVFAM